jgi:TolB protein
MRLFACAILLVPLLAGSLLIAGSGTPVKTSRVPAKLGGMLQNLAWSPDGQKFLVTRVHGGTMALWTLNVDGADAKQVLPKGTMPHFDGHWSADSKRIVFVYDTLQGTDGKLQIDHMHADGTNRTTLIPHKGAFEESPRWSPDEQSIAWVSTRKKSQDIWRCDAEGKKPQQLTNDSAFDNNPTWSPDGKKIAFCSGRSGNLDIWVMNADGSDQKRLTTSPFMDYWPVWSPDGKKIAFTSNRDGNYEIYTMNADGTDQRNVTEHPATDNFATWSPDSRRLAFISNRDGTHAIYVMDMR